MTDHRQQPDRRRPPLRIRHPPVLPAPVRLEGHEQSGRVILPGLGILAAGGLSPDRQGDAGRSPARLPEGSGDESGLKLDDVLTDLAAEAGSLRLPAPSTTSLNAEFRLSFDQEVPRAGRLHPAPGRHADRRRALHSDHRRDQPPGEGNRRRPSGPQARTIGDDDPGDGDGRMNSRREPPGGLALDSGDWLRTPAATGPVLRPRALRRRPTARGRSTGPVAPDPQDPEHKDDGISGIESDTRRPGFRAGGMADASSDLYDRPSSRSRPRPPRPPGNWSCRPEPTTTRIRARASGSNCFAWRSRSI